jgi:hypothetical protein
LASGRHLDSVTFTGKKNNALSLMTLGTLYLLKMAASSVIPIDGEDKGITLHTTPVTPAAVLDLAKLEVNCQRMLDVTKKLGIVLRAHVKTHKV